MANGFVHAVTGFATGLATVVIEKETLQKSPALLLAAPAVGIAFGKLPDVIEPAFKKPNHRQFFHSIAFVGSAVYGLKKTYDWRPEDGFERAIRVLVLFAGFGYLSHLVLD